MDTDIVEEQIQAIRKDRKAVEVLGEWYNSFKPLSVEFNKGDNVKIEFTENKGFKNIKKIDKINVLPPLNNNKEHNQSIDTTTLNTLLMTIKDIYIKELDLFIKEKADESLSLNKITEDVLDVYKKVKQSI